MEPERGINREDVEKAIWSLTGYTGDQSAVDALMAVVDAYWLAPLVPQNWAHLLLTLVTQILDSGGSYRLVTGERATPLTRDDIPAIAEAVESWHRTQHGHSMHPVSGAEQRPVDADVEAALARLRESAAPPVQRHLVERPITDGVLYPCAGCGKPKRREAYKTDASTPRGFRTKCKVCAGIWTTGQERMAFAATPGR